MKELPYSGENREKMILRDYLAVDRNALANERTYLAYVRTVLALIAGGVALIHFGTSQVMEVFGWILLPLGMFVFAVGTIRFIKVRNALRRVVEHEHEVQKKGQAGAVETCDKT